MALSITEALEVKRRVEAQLLAIPGVHMVGFGGKLRGGQPTDEFAIIVYVLKKKPKGQLIINELIPEEIDGVKTDVVESSIPIQHMLEGGIEIFCDSVLVGEIHRGVGTLGCFAWRQDTTPPKAVLLSNDHNLYGKKGEVRRNDGDPVKISSSCGADETIIAKLFRTSGPDDPFVDAAIAELEVTMNWLPRVHGLSVKGTLDLRADKLDKLPPAVQSAARKHKLCVKKYGATTGLTVGVCVDFEGGSITRKQQLSVWPIYKDHFSEEGDSGSVIYIDNSTTDNRADVVQQIFGSPPVKNPDKAKIVALLWGGEPDTIDSTNKKKRTFGSHIETVTDRLTIKIATNSPEVVYQVGGEPKPHPAWARIYSDLSGTQRAKELVSLYGKHKEEIRNLLQHSRRFVVVWHRSHGPQIVRALMNLAEKRLPFLPVEFEGQSWADCVDRIADALLDVGSHDLRTDVNRYLPLATQFGGRSYEEILGFLAVADSKTATNEIKPL